MITTADRVTRHTGDTVLRSIHEAMRHRIEYFAQHPEQIPRRLHELDAEWDVERCVETGSASLTLAGLLLGISASRKWLLLSIGVQGFFLQHALQGWCPPLPVLRRLGVRTAEEIAQERYALKALLGHFEGVSSSEPSAASRASRAVSLDGVAP